MAKNDLEERLINFAVLIIEIADAIPKNVAGLTLSGQMIRSSTSAALNYGEAQSAESPRDFLHKIKVVLKEVRETYVNLRIVQGAKLFKDIIKMNSALQENNELVAIFTTSVVTARKNMSRLKKTRSSAT
jgi:four helix bundle protein